ncbi:unnamed protein product [Effrenium voratum]|uniref:Uncharacterized protein n=1 Tax=Effrenium voratum TaxID=2562239 RepID=A0AA36MXG5_9DINO|nr:unnamed protein product [Effrenium voratum]
MTCCFEGCFSWFASESAPEKKQPPSKDSTRRHHHHKATPPASPKMEVTYSVTGMPLVVEPEGNQVHYSLTGMPMYPEGREQLEPMVKAKAGSLKRGATNESSISNFTAAGSFNNSNKHFSITGMEVKQLLS